MENIDLASFFYLLLLVVCIAGWFIAENRRNLGQTARMALAWGMIFFAVVAGYGLWDDVRSDIAPRQAVVEETGAIVAPRRSDGHFHLTLEMNGTPVDFLVDTGATDIVLSLADARRIGIDPDDLAFLGVARTANGEVRTARAFVDDVALGPVAFSGVPVSVNGGEMNGSLLGMAFLSRFDRIEIAGDRLLLEP